MTDPWITDPVLWLLALPALAVTGLLVQMILSRFSCCGAFVFRGRAVQVTWWMTPATAAAAAVLWALAAAWIVWR